MSADYLKTLTSFSGSDLLVSFGKRVVGELQAITWAIQRRKAPVYALGDADAKSFSRGTRGIAGTLTFAVFNRDALIEELKSVWSDIAPPAMYTAAGNLKQRYDMEFQDALSLTDWNRVTSGFTRMNPDGSFVGNSEALDANGLNVGVVGRNVRQQQGSRGVNGEMVDVPPGFSVIRHNNIMYSDMLPPFDITLTFANEYGQTAFQKIYDVDILNEGSGVSVDSLVMERQMTYVARRVSPLIEGIYKRESSDKVVAN